MQPNVILRLKTAFFLALGIGIYAGLWGLGILSQGAWGWFSEVLGGLALSEWFFLLYTWWTRGREKRKRKGKGKGRERLRGIGLEILGIVGFGVFLVCGLRGLWLSTQAFSGVPFVALATLAVVSDTTAYGVGVWCGGPKLWPKISPNKTWSGAVGAFLMVTLLGGIVSHDFLASSVIAIAAQSGDLAESAFKRMLGIKDSGTFFPGHGGILDRIDSWIGVGFAYALRQWLFL